MTTDVMKTAGRFAVFLLVQVLVLGRIHLFGYATPLLYVYFVAQFPRSYPKWALLLWGFAMGLCVDVFSNTPGVAAASLTLVAAVQPYYFELFVPRDSVYNLSPSMAAVGPAKYAYYIVPLVVFYCLLFFSLEMFSFSNWVQWLLCVAGSAAVTLALIFTFELVRSKQ